MSESKLVPVELIDQIQVLMQTAADNGMTQYYPDGQPTPNRLLYLDIVEKLGTLPPLGEPEAYLITYREIKKHGDRICVTQASLDHTAPSVRMDSDVESRTLLKSTPLYAAPDAKCVGYPHCDGDLVAMPHSPECPKATQT